MLKKGRIYRANFFRCLPFLIGLYRTASQSNSPIFESQKQNTKFFRSAEMTGVFSRFSLGTNSEMEGHKNSSKNENIPLKVHAIG